MRLRCIETWNEAFLLVFDDVIVSALRVAAIEDFLGWIQQILRGAGLVPGLFQFLPCTSVSHTLVAEN